MIYYSSRGLQLLWIQSPGDIPIITVEHYLKWYNLQLIMPDGGVIPIPFPGEEFIRDTDECQTAIGDHVVNPIVVRRFAEKMGYHLDDQAFEMIVGRWEIEFRGKYE
jgi:hypothetical protein